MKKAVYILIAFVIPSVCFGAGDMQTILTGANANYARGHYQQAMVNYKQVIDAGYQSVSLYFNMGNACYKTGDIPSALLYYEKAHKLSPGDEDINFNIKFANLKTTDKIDEAPEFFVSKWWRGFILGISANGLGWISVLLVLLASGILILYFFTASVAVKKTSFYGAMLFFILGVFAVFIAGMQVNYFSGHREAIVFSPSVTVKSGPVEKAGALFVIHDGTKVNVLDDTNGWLKIKLANGSEGWIKSGDAREI